MGVRNYPVIGTFGDSYSTHMDDMYARWGKEKVRRYVMGLIRQYKPDVMVTHDKGGEYGHGAHKVTSDASVYCVENAADASVLPALAEAYGTWTVKKLYLHMGDENVIHMDWNVPLDSMAVRRASSSRRKRFCCCHPAEDELCRYRRREDGQRQIFARIYRSRAGCRRRGLFENVE